LSATLNRNECGNGLTMGTPIRGFLVSTGHFELDRLLGRLTLAYFSHFTFGLLYLRMASAKNRLYFMSFPPRHAALPPATAAGLPYRS
jgi:hypothetical protein